MATATSSAFTLQENIGRDVITLSSYAGSITWTTTPVSGDQIEYPTGLTVANDGSIEGPVGSYTVRHIVAATGAIQAVSHVRAAGKSASTSVELDTDITDSFSYVTLTSYSGPMTFTTTPVAGDQIVFPNTISIAPDGSFTGANATYTVWHIIASTGAIEGLSYTQSGANTAPAFGGVSNVVATVGDIDLFSIAATDPDVGDTLSYSVDVLPSGINLTGSNVQGVYFYEETVESTFTVNDGAGGTDTAVIVFSIARSGYTVTTLDVSYGGLNPDSPLNAAITDSDLLAGDQVDYPLTVTDAAGNTRTVSFASDGLMTVNGTRSVKVDGIYIRDKSAGYSRIGPFSVTLTGTGPTLTSPLEVVPNSSTTSGGQMRFTSDEGSEVAGANGDYRLIAIPRGFGTPTKSQVMAGQGPDGNAALFDSGLQQQAATVEEIVTVNGLPTAGAGYWIFLCLEDQHGGRTLEGPVVLSTIATGTAPVWSSIPDQNVSTGSAFSIDLSAFATDANSYSISGILSGSGVVGINSTTGVLTGTPNTTVDSTGAAGTTQTQSLTVTATNATGSSSIAFDLLVYRINPPTILQTLTDRSWQENVPVSLSLNEYIGNSTSYELQIDGSDATATLATYGITFNSTTGAITGTPNALSVTNSPYSMRARGTNADGSSAWQTFTTTISASAPPVFSGPITGQSLTVGQAFTLDVSVYFTGAISYSLLNIPIGSNLTINNSGIITGTPNSSDFNSSPYTVTVRATNSDGSTDGTFIATVTQATTPTLTAGFPDLSFAIGSPVSVTFSNYISGATSYVVSGLPAGTGIIQTATGLGGVFTNTDDASSPFIITVQGVNENGSVSDSFLINTLTAAEELEAIFDPSVQFVKFYGDPYRTKTKALSDNWSQVQFYNDGIAFELNNSTNIICTLIGDSTFTLNKIDNPLSFDLSPLGGKFNVRLSDSGATAGNYLLNIDYFDTKHPDGVCMTAERELQVIVK